MLQSWSIYRCLLGEGEHLAKLLEQDQAGGQQNYLLPVFINKVLLDTMHPFLSRPPGATTADLGS